MENINSGKENFKREYECPLTVGFLRYECQDCANLVECNIKRQAQGKACKSETERVAPSGSNRRNPGFEHPKYLRLYKS